MSEKITFGELIESIAEETDQSKQFTHDFFKDFVDIIHGGLEEDGKVNIAGLGKFSLKRVDEREGYNPQTEEKMTIPAHNKVVFKPYKDLRERVNEPYADLESELLGDDKSADQEEEQKSESTSTEETSVPESSKKEKQESDADIVEFQGAFDEDEEKEVDRELEEFIGNDDSDEELESDQTEKVNSEEVAAEETDDVNDAESILEEDPKQKVPEDTDSGTKQPDRKESKNGNTLFYITAAAGILLILFAGAWYLNMFSPGETKQIASKKTVTTNTAQNAQAANRASESGNAVNKTDNPAQQVAQTTNQTTASSDKETKQSKNGNSQKEAPKQSAAQKENVSIEKGMTLWSLAEEKYGNPRLWPWIYGNNGRLENPDLIIAGNSLDVPLPSGPQNSLTSTDSVGVSKGFLATYQWYKDNNPSKARNHLWAATLYHDNIRNIADVKIDEEDLSYTMKAR